MPIWRQLSGITGVAKEISEAAARPSRRHEHYLRGRGGSVLVLDGPLAETQARQVKADELTSLTETQIRAYLDGEDLPPDHVLEPARGRPH